MNSNSQKATTHNSNTLAHERLDAYRVALEFLTLAHTLVQRLPRSKGQLGDQLSRASESVALRIAEGAGCEWRSADQKRHFRASRASAMECSAVLDICGIRGIGSKEQLLSGRGLLYRLVQMLTRLCRDG